MYTMEQRRTRRVTQMLRLASLAFTRAVEAVQPQNALKSVLRLNGSTLSVDCAGRNLTVDLEKKSRIALVGFGKAVHGMTVALIDVLGQRLNAGVISIPITEMSPADYKLGPIEVRHGARNNLPDKASLESSKRIDQLVRSLSSDDLLFVLISGGGSALLSYPKDPMTLDELHSLTRSLSRSGATIDELNYVRKCLERLKGGGLVRAAKNATIVSFIVSDIIGDRLDSIASGPTVACTVDRVRFKSIFEKYKTTAVPNSVREVIEAQTIREIDFANVYNFLIASNRVALNAAAECFKQYGYTPLILSDSIDGDVTALAKQYCRLVKSFIRNPTISNICSTAKQLGLSDTVLFTSSASDKIALIFGGEPTIRVTGDGRGGRSQHLALTIASMLESDSNWDIMFLAAGTDGQDGPTTAAGAIAYPGLTSDATAQRFDVHEFLARNDSCTFFERFSNGAFHIVTGASGTNVMDLHFILLANQK